MAMAARYINVQVVQRRRLASSFLRPPRSLSPLACPVSGLCVDGTYAEFSAYGGDGAFHINSTVNGQRSMFELNR